MMRILMSVHHLLDPNAGAAGVTVRLAEGFRSLGHEVDTLSMSDMNLRRETVMTHVRFPWFVYSQLRRRYKHYDVLDLSSGDGWVLQHAVRRVRQLIVARSHGLEHIAHGAVRNAAARGEEELSWKYPLYHGNYRLWEVAESFRKADLSLFLNRGDRDFAVAKLRVPRDHTRVVDNGMANSFLGLPFAPTQHSGLRIAVVGTYSNRKINMLPSVINHLFGKQPDWRIGFFGTGVEEAVVRKDFDPSIQDRIGIVRHYDNNTLREYLRGYDLLLFPSLSEGFPLSVLEAMGCGLALVSSALETLTGRLTEGREAMFFPPADAEALKRILRYLGDSPEKLLSLRRAGHTKAQQFSWQRIALDTCTLYEEAIAAKQGKLVGQR